MISRPMMISPEIKTQDYTEFVRNSANAAHLGSASFAQAMHSEGGSTRQSSGRSGFLSMPPATNADQTANQATDKGGSDERQTGTGLAASPAIPLDPRSLSTLRRLAENVLRPLASHDEGSRRTRQSANGASLQTADSEDMGLGRLSARYESGSQGISAIGYDRNGGTSYGKYQISSRQGSFRRFLDYAAKEAPDIAERLSKAGAANTGSRRGAVPEAWKAIAAEQPDRFEKLQEGFIRQSHYEPAENQVKTVLGTDELSPTMQEVLWSTAVQHGPTGARRLFERAAERLSNQGKKATDEKALIETLYSLRGNQFASSTPSVQAAVRQRFDTEKRQALAMLQEQSVLQEQSMLA